MFEAADIRNDAGQCLPYSAGHDFIGDQNCGFGPTDVGTLPQKAVDLETGWVKIPRPKTGLDRRIPLGLITVSAIQKALEVRPKAKRGFGHLLFVTKEGLFL